VRLFYTLILVLLFSICISAQNDMPVITASDFPGIKINRTESYSGNSLWGYIDGGADLYLEYGFNKLAAQEIVDASGKYIIDIYKMDNPESAFGIYSISKFKCSGTSISKFSCITEYQIMIARGSYYISVVNEKATPEQQKFAGSLAEKILSRIDEKDFEIPGFFSQVQFKGGEFLLIKGILGVQNRLNDWETLFEGIDKFTLNVCTADEGGKYTITSRIKFASKEDSGKFQKNAQNRKADGIKTGCSILEEEEVLYTETNKI